MACHQNHGIHKRSTLITIKPSLTFLPLRNQGYHPERRKLTLPPFLPSALLEFILEDANLIVPHVAPHYRDHDDHAPSSQRRGIWYVHHRCSLHGPPDQSSPCSKYLTWRRSCLCHSLGLRACSRWGPTCRRGSHYGLLPRRRRRERRRSCDVESSLRERHGWRIRTRIVCGGWR